MPYNLASPIIRLTPDLEDRIRHMFHEGYTQADVHRATGLSKSTVAKVRRRYDQDKCGINTRPAAQA